jgi:hypothetical protein
MGLIMSELIEQLAGKLGIAVQAQGALRLIQLQECEKIVEECKASNLLILGIEAFLLPEGKVIPDTDLIADFSELASKQSDIACLEAAHSAKIYFDKLKGRTNLWFDFSLK